MALRARVKDIEDQLERLRRRLTQVDVENDVRSVTLVSNDREIKEVRTRLWPLFAMGDQAIEELLRRFRDVEDAVANLPNTIAELDAMIDAVQAGVTEVRDDIAQMKSEKSKKK